MADKKKVIVTIAVAGALAVTTALLISKKAEAAVPEEGRQPIVIVWQ